MGYCYGTGLHLGWHKLYTDMKVSLFVHDLAGNPIARAIPIAQALGKLGYDVEILGLLISGDCVFKPYRDAFSYKFLPATAHMNQVLAKARRLSDLATGDIIYAFKPLWTSFWPALLASGFGKKKLLLDVEDDEWWMDTRGFFSFFVNNVIRGWNFSGSLKYKLLLHPFTHFCHQTTVVSRKLRARYGGTIVLHGVDRHLFNPGRLTLTKDVCRRKFRLPLESPLVLFAGTPRRHKGISTIVDALMCPAADNYTLVLAGNKQDHEFERAAALLGDRCVLLGFVDHLNMPSLIAAVDVVATPQHSNAFTQSQIPAKLLEAMAMAKPVVVTRVSDLALIVGENERNPRGWVIEPENTDQLANVLKYIYANPGEARKRGNAARCYFMENACDEVIGCQLQRIIDNCARCVRSS